MTDWSQNVQIEVENTGKPWGATVPEQISQWAKDQKYKCFWATPPARLVLVAGNMMQMLQVSVCWSRMWLGRGFDKKWLDPDGVTVEDRSHGPQ